MFSKIIGVFVLCAISLLNNVDANEVIRGRNSEPIQIVAKNLPKPIRTTFLSDSIAKSSCFKKQTLIKPAHLPLPIFNKTLCPSPAVIPIKNNNNNNNDAKLANALAEAAKILTQKSTLEKRGINVSSLIQQVLSGIYVPTPADSVSLDLAFKQSQISPKIAEEKLFYGFRRFPIELPCIKPKVLNKSFPEESLYAINGDIFELKQSPEPVCNRRDLSQEAEKELMDLELSEECKKNIYQPIRRPTLTDLGYFPTKGFSTINTTKNNNFSSNTTTLKNPICTRKKAVKTLI